MTKIIVKEKERKQIKNYKFYTSRYDRTFKDVMLNEKSKDILKPIFEKILGKKIYKIELLPTEEIEESIKIKRKIVDAYLETNEGRVNVEVNSNIQSYVYPRNMAYLCNMYERYFLSNETYTEKIKFIQLNLTYGLNKIRKEDEELIRRYDVRDEEGNLFVNNFIIYEVNMDNVMKLWYDNDKEKIEEYKHLIMLDLNKEDLKKLSKDDKVVRKYMERVIRVNSNPEFQEYMSKEEDERKIRNSQIEEATEKGFQSGFNNGLYQDKLFIAKNLLSMDMKIEDIVKATGLSIEEIKKLDK